MTHMTDFAAQVTFINVGNGDAILVEVSDENCREGRFVMLIDGGSNENTEYEETATGRIRAADYLEQKGIGILTLWYAPTFMRTIPAAFCQLQKNGCRENCGSLFP